MFDGSDIILMIVRIYSLCISIVSENRYEPSEILIRLTILYQWATYKEDLGTEWLK